MSRLYERCSRWDADKCTQTTNTQPPLASPSLLRPMCGFEAAYGPATDEKVGAELQNLARHA